MLEQICVYSLVAALLFLEASCFGAITNSTLMLLIIHCLWGINLILSDIERKLRNVSRTKVNHVKIYCNFFTPAYFFIQIGEPDNTIWRKCIALALLFALVLTFRMNKYKQENAIFIINMSLIIYICYYCYVTKNSYGMLGSLLLAFFQLSTSAELGIVKATNACPLIKSAAVFFLLESIYPDSLSKCTTLMFLKELIVESEE